MAEHLEFLRKVPGAAQSLGPTPPLDPVTRGPQAGRPAIDPLHFLRAELQKRLDVVSRDRSTVIRRMREDHRTFIELEAGAAALVTALTDLERHRLATSASAESEAGDGA